MCGPGLCLALSLLIGQAPDPPIEKRLTEGKTETTTSVDLDGPIAGLRFWF